MTLQHRRRIGDVEPGDAEHRRLQVVEAALRDAGRDLSARSAEPSPSVPIRFIAAPAVTATPSRPLPSAAAPVLVVPTKLPATMLPLVPAPVMVRPLPPLPLMRLPAPAVLPPTVLFEEPEVMDTPEPVLPT